MATSFCNNDCRACALFSQPCTNVCFRNAGRAAFLLANRTTTSYTMESQLDLNHPAIDEEFSAVYVACIFGGEE